MSKESFVPSGSIYNAVSLKDYLTDIDRQKIANILDLMKIQNIGSDINEIEKLLLDNGKNLSGGQKQRIALARAIFYRRKILILDEPTSSVDHELEAHLIKEVNNLRSHSTIIIISHKESSLIYCNKIFSLSNKSLIQIK